MNETQIAKILETINGAAAETVNQYQIGFFLQALSWSIFSLICLILGVLIWRKINPKNISENENFSVDLKFFLSILLFIISAILFFTNLPNLINSRGTAIQTLIRDIRN